MTVLYFLATIVLLVVIHEWGHFVLARFFGVGVRSFTVGFGKQFISWVDPKTGTSWGLAPYPIGGYVGLLGEKEAALSALETKVVGNPFMTAPLHAKLLILLAGPMVNLVFAALVYSFLTFNGPNSAVPLLAAPGATSAAALAGLQSGDLITQVNGASVASWRDVQTELLHIDSGQIVTLGIAGSSELKSLTMPSPITQKSADEILGLRLFSKGLVIQLLLPEGAAFQAGMKVGDVMLQINGKVIDHPDVLIDVLRFFKQDSPPIEIEVDRSGQKAVAYVTPLRDANQVYRIGVQFAGLPQLNEESVSVFDALKDGFKTAYEASLLTIKAFGSFLLKPFNSDQLAGPITIAKTAKASADKGWMAALAFVAGLSISVGVLNLLPVPVLDGGQIVYHTVKSVAEAVGLKFKISVSERLNHWWISLGVSFVIMLTLLAFFTDFKRLFSL